VFVTFAAIAAARANGTFKVTFPHIDINGIKQLLPYSCPDLRDSSSPPILEKYFFPTDHIFTPGACHKTSLPSGNKRWLSSVTLSFLAWLTGGDGPWTTSMEQQV